MLLVISLLLGKKKKKQISFDTKIGNHELETEKIHTKFDLKKKKIRKYGREKKGWII